jgi:hypothetical protein
MADQNDNTRVIQDALNSPKQMATAEGTITERSAEELIALLKEKERQTASKIASPWGIRMAKNAPTSNFG